MNLTRNLLLIAGLTLGGFTACNYTVGECYPRGQGSESAGAVAGAGGSIVNPPGVGGFGDAPPKQPQDATNPPFDCNSHDTETPKPSPASTCKGSGSTTADGATIEVCSTDCTGKCSTSGVNGPFGASIFKFATIIADDGTKTPGGWQEAWANLRIVRSGFFAPEIWYCPVHIGIPLRTEVNGVISPDYAATITTQVANKAALKVRDNVPDAPQGVFCTMIKTQMTYIFASDAYRSFGARMMSP